MSLPFPHQDEFGKNRGLGLEGKLQQEKQKTNKLRRCFCRLLPLGRRKRRTPRCVIFNYMMLLKSKFHQLLDIFFNVCCTRSETHQYSSIRANRPAL